MVGPLSGWPLRNCITPKDVKLMAREHILVVEDEQIIAKDIQSRLTQMGYPKPAIAASGEEALHKVARLSPGLVLMDIVLKGEMDGVQTAERIRDRFDIPVVYLTAYADDQTVQRAKRTEPFGYLLKPIVDGQLQTTIEIALYKHRMEHNLRQSEKWLSTTLRCVGDAVITTDTQGNVTFLNPIAEALTGWRQDEAVGRDISEVFHIVDEATRVAPENPATKAMCDSAVVHLGEHHLLLVTKDGATRAIDDSAAPLTNDQGHIIGSVLIFHDVTDRRQRQAELLKTRKLEALGTMAGGIAHTFNNILMTIVGRLSLAKLLTPPDTPLFRHLVEAEQAAQRATGVTRQWLTFAKGGAPVKQSTALHRLLQETTSRALEGYKVQPIFSLADDLWSVDIDRGQIRQAIYNIVLNAAQAMPGGGTLQVQAHNVVVDTTHRLPLPEGPYIGITLTDQGGGIPPQHVDKILDPYFTTKQHHSGLGLTVAYAIVTQHQGSLVVDSTVGVGTTVQVYLPALSSSSVPDDDLAGSPQTHQSKILVMDDEDAIRRLVTEMLRRLGYEAVCAQDGAEALDLYRRAKQAGQPFTAVLMDLNVPHGMGGKEAMASLRDLDPAVKAIVSSGYSNDPVMADFRRYGFSGMIAKPYRLAELGAILQQVIDDPQVQADDPQVQ
jgi:two-component system cell cycle sensor histidine kinase/response regulator CckA